MTQPYGVGSGSPSNQLNQVSFVLVDAKGFHSEPLILASWGNVVIVVARGGINRSAFGTDTEIFSTLLMNTTAFCLA